MRWIRAFKTDGLQRKGAESLHPRAIKIKTLKFRIRKIIFLKFKKQEKLGFLFFKFWIT